MRTPCARFRLLSSLFGDAGRLQGRRLERIQQGLDDPPRHMIEAGMDGLPVDPAGRHAAARPGAGALDRVPDLGALRRSARMLKTGTPAALDRHALAAGRGDLLAVEAVVGAYAVVSGAEEPFGEAPKGSPSTINSTAASVSTAMIWSLSFSSRNND